ncbi:MAG TPA: prolyl oligopeptidase family serine peptidase, partial [Chitinophagaceae bacterium]|nr:prolyl oligopeptidase family serine peptidase [Chitinophagaceae bacterium]
LAVISFFGPTDIEDLYNFPAYPQVPQLLELLLGGSPTSNPAIYKQSSPVTFITSQSCPTLLFQGGKDLLVTPKQSALLKDKLTAAGVVNELIVYPNEGHGWHGNNLGDSFQKITRFLSAHVDRD